MRRAEFLMSRSEAAKFLASQAVVRIASTTEDGSPLLRTVHGVVVDDALCFHGAPKGEKVEAVGRPTVAQAEELVATVPSTFFDPESACPATTYYRSVQVHGVLERVDDPTRKGAVLQALMRHLQPEGGHRPITADDALYRPAVNGLLVVALPLATLEGKAKLAQNRPAEQRRALLEQLWARGAPGDARAIELIRAANPDTPTPTFLQGPTGVTLHCAMEAAAADEAAALVAPEYWNDRFTADDLARAHRGSAAWVGGRDAAGRLIGTARALSDGGKYAWVYDVCVSPSARGLGLGQALMRLLLDHPNVRSARRVLLGTRDAQGLYRRFGFVAHAELPPRPYASTEMVLVRPVNPPQAVRLPGGLLGGGPVHGAATTLSR